MQEYLLGTMRYKGTYYITTIVFTTDFRLSDYHLPVARIGQHWQSVAARAGLSTAHSSARAAAPGLLAPPSGGGGLPIKKIM